MSDVKKVLQWLKRKGIIRSFECDDDEVAILPVSEENKGLWYLDLTEETKATAEEIAPIQEMKATIIEKIKKAHSFDLGQSTLAHCQTSQSMGIGELASFAFVRKFRFLLKSNNFPELEKMVTDVHVNFAAQELSLGIYECYSNTDKFYEHVQHWLYEQTKHLSNDLLALSVYDACGERIYSIEFMDLSVFQDCLDFDYSDSGASVRKIVLHYRRMKR